MHIHEEQSRACRRAIACFQHKRIYVRMGVELGGHMASMLLFIITDCTCHDNKVRGVDVALRLE